MYAELNACRRKRLGACMRILGACLSKVWVHVCGCWVQSMRLLGAKYAVVGCKVCGFWAQLCGNLGCMYAVVGCKSMERLGACMTVGSFA